MDYMNKKTGIIFAGIIILVLLGFVFMNKPKKIFPAVVTKTSTTPAARTTVAVAHKTETVQGTMKSLMTAGKSEVCTYTNETSGTTVNGTMYVSGGKMRVDFTAVNTGKNEKVNSHMIVTDAQTAYAWTDLTNRGMKISLTTTTTPSTANNGSPDLNKQVQFSCQEWTQDLSLFVVPSNVTFYSINASAACSACDNLSAQAKEICKAQLNCQ